MRFDRFVGIDWSGAKGPRQKGLAVAICEAGTSTPQLVHPEGAKYWSREGIGDWIASLPGRSLVGIDSAFSLPFDDEDAFLPGETVGDDAMSLWVEIENSCSGDAHLYGGGFVSRHAAHYHITGGKGGSYARRLRVTEQRSIDDGHGPCESVFHLIGPSQVGLSGLSTIRMLKRLQAAPGVRIWPFETVEDARVAVVEIYAACFARHGGHTGKIREPKTLVRVLTELGCENAVVPDQFSDDAADALITAAGLRRIAGESIYWNPGPVFDRVRAKEGWIFGVV